MSKHAASITALALALAACGGGSSGGSTGGPPTAVTPTPPPAPVAPAPTYRRYAELTGDQSFRTACTAIEFGVSPPASRGASAFGQGLTLAYTAATDSYAITGDGQNASFGPADRDPAAPAGSLRWIKNVAGFTQRFSIGTPVVAGTTLEYTRGFGLTVASFAGRSINYSCIFGVPTVVTDAPAGSNIVFTRVAVNGAAYVQELGVLKSYSLTTSTATFAVNTITGRIDSTLRLVGVEQTATGPTGPEIQLGEYTGISTIDTSVGSYSGTFEGPGPAPNASGQFGGWFFGPQGAEAALVMSIVGNRPSTSFPMRVVGTITALQR